ncbi:MAG: hypothetical protein CMI67_21800 [Pelagibaca sp.]|nr:hypothetical protein [Pelagibaca sp.]
MLTVMGLITKLKIVWVPILEIAIANLLTLMAISFLMPSTMTLMVMVTIIMLKKKSAHHRTTRISSQMIWMEILFLTAWIRIAMETVLIMSRTPYQI